MLTMQLVKKDFLLAKKQIFMMMLVSVGVPVFVTWSMAGSFATVLALIFSLIFTQLLLLQYVSVAEAKYPKAAALLHAAPYSRRAFVMGKYVFFLLIFAYCTIVTGALGLMIPRLGSLDMGIVLAVLLCNILIYGAYLPIHFKLGYEKTKFFFSVAVFILSFGSVFAVTNPLNIDLSALTVFFEIPALALNSFLLLLCVILLYISINISVKIYESKDL